MQIEDVETIEFTYESSMVRDDHGHTHPGPAHETTGTITRVVVDGGPDGYAPGGSRAGSEFAAEVIRGYHPLERERVWRRLNRSQRLGQRTISNPDLSAVDCALWDAAGRYVDEPVYRLLGGSGGEVTACAYTMVGDDDPEGLGTPEAYATFARSLVDEGYRAIELHAWMPPYGANPDRDIAACRAVRDAVGDEIGLAFDAYHHYGRREALQIGRALGELGFLWLQEPMDEYSISAYVWLTRELDVPVLGPKTADGKARTRAEWITREAADVIRVSIRNAGGLTPAIRSVHLCDAFRVPCEVLAGGAPALHLLGGLPEAGTYYRRGLLHPKTAYDTPPWLSAPIDPMARDGTISVPDTPGLGYEIDWEFVEANRVDPGQ